MLDVAGHRRIQIELPGRGQMQHLCRGKRLGDARNVHHRLRRQRPPSPSRPAAPAYHSTAQHRRRDSRRGLLRRRKPAVDELPVVGDHPVQHRLHSGRLSVRER